MTIKKIIAILLAVLMLISMLAGCRKIGGNDLTSNTSSDVSIHYSNVDIVDNESEPQSLIDTSSEDENDTSTDKDGDSQVTNSGDTSGNSNNNSGGTGGNTNNNTGTSGNNSNGSNIKDTNDNNNNDDGGSTNEEPPEIPKETVVLSGKGTSDEPYEGYLSEDGTFLSNEIPAGKSFYYNIRGIANRILTINSQNAYVVYNGERHNAENGKVSFFIESDAQDGDFVKIEIGNSGTKAQEFPVVFEFLKGSLGAPEKISSIANSIKHSLEEGNADGYVFRYTAEKDGTIRFYLLSDKKKGQLMVSNIRNSATISTESLEEGEVKTDDVGTYVELEVKKGDNINVTVGIKPNSRNQYKATTIEFLLKYS